MSQGKAAGGASAAAAGGQQYWRTPSIAAALSAALPPSKRLNGVTDLRKSCGIQAQINELNVPSAGYNEDRALMQQLRTISSAKQLAAFLLAVLLRQARQGQRQQPQRQQRREPWAERRKQERRQQEEQQERQRQEREQEQKQQRAQRRMQRMMVQEGLEQPGVAGLPQLAASPPTGSRKRKQQVPVRLPQLQAAAGADLGAETAAGRQPEPQQQQQHDTKGDLPPMRLASPAKIGGAVGAPLGAVEQAAQRLQPPQAAQGPHMAAAALGSSAAQPGPWQREQQQQQQQQQLGGAGEARPAQGEPDRLVGGPAPVASPQQASAAAAPLLQPSQASAALMSARAAEAAQRRVEQAAQAFAAADREVAASMLRPLQQLLLALGKKGGATLQEVVAGWASYSLARQQDLFDAALVVASEGDWGQLEGQLRLALDLTAEG